MKHQKTALTAILLTAILLLSACGASSSTGFFDAAGGDKYAASAPAGAPMAPVPAPMENGWMEEAGMDFAEPSAQSSAAPVKDQAAKRIYTAYLQLETTEFDRAQQEILNLTEQMGGYLSNSSMGEYGGGYRNGEFTVRIPAERFDAFLQQAGQLCHITWQSSSCEDVSEYYYDTAGRLETQRMKLSRLQELMSRAESMEDIITLETAISDTEMQIEYLSGELQHYDALVEYSTVTLSLQEVYRLSEDEQTPVTFLQRLGGALASGWRGFTVDLEELAVDLAYNWVWVLILLAVVVAAVRFIRRRRRKKAEKIAAQERDKA